MYRLVKRLNEQEAAVETYQQRVALWTEKERVAAIISRVGKEIGRRQYPMFGGSIWYRYKLRTYRITYWGGKVDQIVITHGWGCM